MKVENMSNKMNSPFLYKKENTLLNMIAVPYFGVYSPNYTFCMPSNILHTNEISETIFAEFPESLQYHFAEFHKSNKVELEYFMVTLDGTFLCNKYSQNTENGFLRLNYVPHPYIFHNVANLNQDHSTHIYSALFAEAPYENFLKETNEYDGLRINPKKFMTDENKKEIILHKSDDNFPALSPNNCSVLINTNKVFFTLYNMSLVTYKGKVVKCMVAQFNFFLSNDIKLLSPLLNTLNSFNYSTEDAVSDLFVNLYGHLGNISWAMNLIFAFFSSKLIEDDGYGYVVKHNSGNFESINTESNCNKGYCKEVIKNIFTLYFLKALDESIILNSMIQGDNPDEGFVFINDEDMKSITDFYFNDICFFIWFNLGCPRIDNFGEEVLFAHNNYIIEILQKYLKKCEYDIKKFTLSYITFIKEVAKAKKVNLTNEEEIKKKSEILEGKLQDEITDTMNKEVIKRASLGNIGNQFWRNKNEGMERETDINGNKNKDMDFFTTAHSFFHYYKKKQSNPEIDKIRELLDFAFNANLEKIKESLTFIHPVYQKFIFHKVWERKGKIMGIHNDFGRLSLINSKQIPQNYHCNQEEIVEILLEICGIIESFDSK